MRPKPKKVDAYTDEMTLARAIDKVMWASVGSVSHPTAECQQYRITENDEVRCTCGLWRALRVISEDRFGRMLIAYAKDGTLPR